MSCRPINEAQAKAILQILVEECGLHPSSGAAMDFVRLVIVPDGTFNAPRCGEYRFQGALGFGGKFRNNGNYDNTPHVDCYGEDETAKRREMINRANERIAALFEKG